MKRILSIGELLIRLDSDQGEFNNKSKLELFFGGAEFNVANNLSYWGNDVSFFTKIPENFISQNALDFMKSFGTDYKHIKLTESGKIGVYYLKNGFGPINSKVCYDRANSEFAKLNLKDLEELNTDEFDIVFISGISLGVSELTRNSLIQFLKKIKSSNKTIIFDFNYRSKLWTTEEAKSAFNQVIKLIDIAILGIKDLYYFMDCSKTLDFSLANIEAGYKNLFEKNKNLKIATCTNRKIEIDGTQFIEAVMYDGEKITTSGTSLKLNNIIDRIGSGDAFAAGFINGYLNGWRPKEIIDFALSSCYLKHYFKGDSAKIEIDDIKNCNKSKDVLR